MLDLTFANSPTFWNSLKAIAGIMTLLVALLVYREARSIRQIEWAFNAASKWQEFNKFLVDADLSERWESLLSESEVHPPLGPKDKRALLMYFNIQMIEFYMIEKRIVPRHALHTMKAGAICTHPA